MAKLSFAKLGLKKKDEIKTITINDQEIEVKQYLPISEKLDIISKVISESYDENTFANPIRVRFFLALEILKQYTNITFTEKQLEDAPKIYDLLVENKILDLIMSVIPEEETALIYNGTFEIIEEIYKFNHSALGILEALSKDYKDLEFDATSIQEKLSNGEGIELVKSILTNLD